MADCIFCKIAQGEIATDFVYQDEEIVAFKDIQPRAPVHILVIPRKHIASLAELTAEDIPLLGKLNYAVKQIAEREGIAATGYRLICNCREDSGQEVAHLHYHLLGGHFLGAFVQE